MRSCYLKSNIRPLTNVRKLFWRLISVAELSAIAPNICRVTALRECKHAKHRHCHSNGNHGDKQKHIYHGNYYHDNRNDVTHNNDGNVHR